jgi:hypothetical protein
MPNVKQKPSFRQAKQMVNSLGKEEQRRMLVFLENSLWSERLRRLIKSVKEKMPKRISMRDITVEVERVRSELYARSC